MNPIRLPGNGSSREEVFARLEDHRQDDANWKDARMFAFVYRTDDDIMEVGREAFSRFITENGLSPFAFPSLRRFETEVVAMTAAMLNGDGEVVGNVTSGGTESILMAVKAVRDRAREHKPHIRTPEMIIPTTAHPAWDKAGHLLDVHVIHIPVGEDFRVDPQAVKAAISTDTILLVGSAPTYPHGVVDPIEALGGLALEFDLWLHVDACVGGFVLPFARTLGYDIPPFDFAVPGVTSISADVHKFGYAPKGVSTVLYRNGDHRKHQFYVYTEWPGGIYGTPTLSGARTGGAVAAAWAVMNYLGEEGYLRVTRTLLETTSRIIDGINAIPGLRVLGRPQSSVFAVASDEVNIFAVTDAMKRRGWYMENQQFPASIHITVSPGHSEVVDALLRDFAAAIDEARDLPESDLSEAAVMYGMMGTLPDRAMAKEFAMQYLDGVYRL